MRRLAALWALFVAAPALAQEIEPSRRVRVETEVPKVRVWVHEPFTVALRVSWDRDFFARHAVPLFRRALDVPLQVEAPWIHALDGARAVAATPPARGRIRVAAADEVITAARDGDRIEEGRTFSSLVVSRCYAAGVPGRIALAAPRVRFAFATRFDDDLVGERVATDREEVLVAGAPAEVTVLALPEEGRPPGFTDAVGRFTVAASLDRSSLAVGESVVLTARIEGDGNLDAFEPPRLDAWAGLHRLASLDDRGAPVRTLTYEFRVLDADLTRIPAFELPHFDPARGAYAVAAAAPISIDVRAGAAAESTPAASRRRWPWLVAGAGLVAAAFAAGAVALRRRRRACRADPREARAREAAEAFLARAAEHGTDAGPAFVAYLAARLGCREAEVVAPDLAQRLEASGIPEGVARRAASLAEDLVAARYAGGAAASADAGRAREIVDALESAFARRAFSGG